MGPPDQCPGCTRLLHSGRWTVCPGCWREAPEGLRVAVAAAFKRRMQDPTTYEELLVDVVMWARDRAAGLHR